MDKEIAKRTKFERITSIIHKQYNESDSSVNIDDRNSENANGENNIDFIVCENDCNENENNDVLRHYLSSSESSTENFSENSNVYNPESIDNRCSTESEMEEDNLQDSVSSEDTDLEDEQLQCAHVEELGQFVARMISEWAREEGLLSMHKIESLLRRLHPAFPNLCRTYKTLLKTPSNIELIHVNGGELWYKGITFNLDSMNLNDYLERFNEIVIDINIDGLPISKSSPSKF